MTKNLTVYKVKKALHKWWLVGLVNSSPNMIWMSHGDLLFFENNEEFSGWNCHKLIKVIHMFGEVDNINVDNPTFKHFGTDTYANFSGILYHDDKEVFVEDITSSYYRDEKLKKLGIHDSL